MEETKTKKPPVIVLLICVGVLLCAAVAGLLIWEKLRPQPVLQPTTVQTTAQTTTVETTIFVDVTPPVITGAADKQAVVGETVAYRSGVTATDIEDGEVAVQVDASAVDATKAGTYPVRYWAEDSAGNRTEVTAQVTFIAEEAEEKDAVKKDYQYYAKKVYSSIIKKGMSEKEKIKAIWKWCRYKISYSATGAEGDWKQVACTGFTKRKGDCYTYFATSKALLELAEVPTKDVVKIKKEGRSDHYWLLVKHNGSWYHFDSCPRRGANGKTFCLYTDQQMLEFSETHEDCFDFDLRLYPRTPGEIADKYLIKFYPELFPEDPTEPTTEVTQPPTTAPETTPPEETTVPTPTPLEETTPL
ncbi:MAG: transglutaminase domain-containing protein [Oscillospiraceae bacterium]|nr:transglutaminase domain-containing protein [Oscillospiraceae bacterium]